jgi:hypothetical protein
MRSSGTDSAEGESPPANRHRTLMGTVSTANVQRVHRRAARHTGAHARAREHGVHGVSGRGGERNKDEANMRKQLLTKGRRRPRNERRGVRQFRASESYAGRVQTCLEHDASKSGSDLPSRSSISATRDFFLHGGPAYGAFPLTADSRLRRIPTYGEFPLSGRFPLTSDSHLRPIPGLKTALSAPARPRPKRGERGR